MEKLSDLINNHNWYQIITKYKPEEVVKELDLQKGIILAYRMLYNREFDEEVQNYAVMLIYEIRKNYSQEWDADWRYDAFLGEACDLTLKYEERFDAYYRASKKTNLNSPSLLVMLAHCYISPGIPPISQKKAEELLLQSLNVEKTIEGVSLIKRIYEQKGDEDKVAYWNRILNDVTKTNARVHDLQPKFLKNIPLE